jgi:hypothetical protein
LAIEFSTICHRAILVKSSPQRYATWPSQKVLDRISLIELGNVLGDGLCSIEQATSKKFDGSAGATAVLFAMSPQAILKADVLTVADVRDEVQPVIRSPNLIQENTDRGPG